MGRLFTYGRLNKVATIPGANHLPGTYFNAYGIQYGAGAFNVSANSMEPGEIVEIEGSTDKGYKVKRATASITAATSAILLRDVMGVRSIQEGVFEEYIPGTPMTCVPASAPQGWSIVVPVVAGEVPVVGNTVYVGLGTNGTVLGGVYDSAQGSGGADSIALTGWTFQSLKFTPTSGASIAAVIGKI
jgi:hypothetical protein